MNVSATGIVIDHYGDVLLIQRDDTRTLAPPGGAAEVGELPIETVEREVKEETGLIVLPVRLVGLYFLPAAPDNYLSFCFRCIMRGGEIKKSQESLQAGFFKAKPLPKPMLDFHKKRIQNSLAHHDGPPILSTQEFSWQMRLGKKLLDSVVYPWLQYRRRQKGSESYQAPPQWRVLNHLIIRNKDGHIAWIKSAENQQWTLPTIESQQDEAPWETATKAVQNPGAAGFKLTRLAGVYPAKEHPLIALTYMAATTSDQPIFINKQQAKFFDIEKEPAGSLSIHVSWLHDALKTRNDIHYERANLF